MIPRKLSKAEIIITYMMSSSIQGTVRAKKINLRQSLWIHRAYNRYQDQFLLTSNSKAGLVTSL